MNNGSIRYYSIAILLFTVLLSSCLKETAIPIESAFTIEASSDKTFSVTIQLKTESYSANEYERTSRFLTYRSIYPPAMGKFMESRILER